ncbi:MAG TPA: hypothetical protein VKX16_19255 [Chloroflexota bacterium]|nr:hypothetical protein [Chloroflexota bacterium]
MGRSEARYPFPWDLFGALALALPFGYRSLAHDAVAMTERIRPAARVQGLDCVPENGPVVVMANHYQRRGLWIAWPAAVITSVFALRRGQEPPVHWLVTGGLRLNQTAGKGPEVPGSGRIFRAVARAYGFTALPLSGNRARARALREWLRHADRGKAIGMFPEGLGGSSAGLVQPETGFAGLYRLLATRRIPVLPTGICEINGVLHVTFGQALRATSSPDDRSGETVMRAIAALLPEERRGAYAAEKRMPHDVPLG